MVIYHLTLSPILVCSGWEFSIELGLNSLKQRPGVEYANVNGISILMIEPRILISGLNKSVQILSCVKSEAPHNGRAESSGYVRV